MIVDQQNTAIAMGSGDMPVFATPSMIALMENAAMQIAATYCDSTQTTVGTLINVAHTRATPIGATVQATAVLTSQQGRKLTFQVSVADDKGNIGHGEHQRYIVDREKFMSAL